MFAKKAPIETACQRAQEGMALMKALGISVQDSALRIEQANKGFVEALADVKAADDLFDAQAGYVHSCGQVAQDTVLDLTNLTHQTMVRYLNQVSSLLNTPPAFSAAPAVPPQVPAPTFSAAPAVTTQVPAPAPAAATVATPAAKAEVKAQQEPSPKEEPKAEPKAAPRSAAPVKKAAAKPRRAKRTAAKAAGTGKAPASNKPKAEVPHTAAADTTPTLNAVAEPAKAAGMVAATKPADQAAATASTPAMDVPAAASDETKA